MHKYIPFLSWLPDYKKSYFPKDIVAGLTVGIVIIPQGMAYAMIAGLPPVYGLYASLLPVLVYAFMGTSRQLAVGPVAMDSILLAAGLGALSVVGPGNYVIMAVLLSFMVGFFQLCLGLLRMGFLVNFMSKPVISGFTSAAAIIIIFSQLKHLLGTNVPKSNTFHSLLYNSFYSLPSVNPYDLLLGVSGILIIVLLKKYNPKIPSALLVVVSGIAAAYFFNLEEKNVAIVGLVPQGLPSFIIPDFQWNYIQALWPIALTLALVGYLEAISIGKAMEEKKGEETIVANKELIALGTSNMIGSFFQSYVVTGSFSRSAINFDAGAKTTVASLFVVVSVLITLLFLTPLFYFLPKAVLASIIMVSVYGLIDISYPKELWKYRKDEFFVFLVTFLITLFIGIKEGILVGVLISLLLMVYRTSKPHFAILGHIKNSDYYKNIDRFGEEVVVRDDLLIIRFDAQLYFGNAGYFKEQLLQHITLKGEALKGVILNAEAINYIDSSAAKMLTAVIKEIHNKNISFYIAGAIGPARDIIFSSGIIGELKKEYLFVQTKDAVAYFDHPNTFSPLHEKVAYQNLRSGN